MSNKTVKDNLAKEIQNLYKERDKQIEDVEKLSINKQVKNHTKKKILETFHKKLGEIKTRPWYQEVLEEIMTKKETLEATNKLIIPNGWKEEESQNIFEDLKSISDEEIIQAWEEFEQTIEEEAEEEKWSEMGILNPELICNPTAILEDLQKNYLKVEFDKELFWVKWRFVHLELPPVWNFKWFKFNCFISKWESLTPGEFRSNPNFEKRSYSTEEIAQLLKAINEYMKAYLVETDWDIDYNNGLKDWDYEHWKKKSKVWLDLVNYIWLTDCIYWLKDYEIDKFWNKKYIWWNCYDKNNSCYFNKEDTPFWFFAHLMLKLP